MDEYHFMADVLMTFRSCPDFIKAMIVSGFYLTITICVLGTGYLQVLGKRETEKHLNAEDQTALAVTGTGDVIDFSRGRRTGVEPKER